jgi:hypothetical protein
MTVCGKEAIKLVAGWYFVVGSMFQPLCFWEENIQCALDRKLGGIRSRSGRGKRLN